MVYWHAGDGRARHDSGNTVSNKLIICSERTECELEIVKGWLVLATNRKLRIHSELQNKHLISPTSGSGSVVLESDSEEVPGNVTVYVG